MSTKGLVLTWTVTVWRWTVKGGMNADGKWWCIISPPEKSDDDSAQKAKDKKCFIENMET